VRPRRPLVAHGPPTTGRGLPGNGGRLRTSTTAASPLRSASLRRTERGEKISMLSSEVVHGFIHEEICSKGEMRRGKNNLKLLNLSI
jgi:hypothetical protein